MTTHDTPRVLIVDDHEDNRHILTRIVTRAGFSAASVDNGAASLERVVEDAPDLVLLDWMMPGLSGLDTLRAMREHHDANALPIIMCTALDEDDRVSEALAAGANDYISKPIRADVLIARVRSHLERKAGMAALARQNAELEHALAKRTRELLGQIGVLDDRPGGLDATAAETLAGYLDRLARADAPIAPPRDPATRSGLAALRDYVCGLETLTRAPRKAA